MKTTIITVILSRFLLLSLSSLLSSPSDVNASLVFTCIVGGTIQMIVYVNDYDKHHFIANRTCNTTREYGMTQ